MAGTLAIKEIGGASEGMRTMLDALMPAGEPHNPLCFILSFEPNLLTEPRHRPSCQWLRCSMLLLPDRPTGPRLGPKRFRRRSEAQQPLKQWPLQRDAPTTYPRCTWPQTPRLQSKLTLIFDADDSVSAIFSGTACDSARPRRESNRNSYAGCIRISQVKRSGCLCPFRSPRAEIYMPHQA